MAYGEICVLDFTQKCTTDLTAAIYTPLVQSADETVAAATAGAKCVGFLQNKPNGSGSGDKGDGVEASVRALGITRAVASAAIAAGASVAAAGSNQVATAGTGDFPLGKALNAAAGAGEVVSVVINLSDVPLP